MDINAADAPQGSLAHTGKDYDPKFRAGLAERLIRTIAEASIVEDADIVVFRLGETIDALSDVLALVAAMSPTMDSPTAVRKAAEAYAKNIRVRIAHARASGDVDHVFGARRMGTA